MNATRFFFLFFPLLLKKIQAPLKEKKSHPKKSLTSVLHQAITLLSTCFSLLLGRLSPHFGVPFKPPFSFKMQLTLRIMFLRGLQRKTTSRLFQYRQKHKILNNISFSTGFKAIKETNHVFDKPPEKI